MTSGTRSSPSKFLTIVWPGAILLGPVCGAVTSHRIGDGVTRIMLQIDYEPEGVVQHAGDMLGFVSRRVEGDLERFKTFIESRGQATGEWRGEVSQTKIT